MQPIEVLYRIKISPDQVESFRLRLEPATLQPLNDPPADQPEWTALDYCQCPHCPLKADEHPRCPVAVSLVDIVRKFDRVASFDAVQVEIVTSDRTVSKETSAQKAIGSLFGLLMATSDCPHTGFLKPMARFHLPMSNQEETIYRVSGMYLLAQYFLQREGYEPDFQLRGLPLLYENLHKVNVAMARRLRHWTAEDSSVNAIVVLDVFASILPFAVEDELARIERLFEPYFTKSYMDRIYRRLTPPPD